MKKSELAKSIEYQQRQIACLLLQANEAAERLAKQERTIRRLEERLRAVERRGWWYSPPYYTWYDASSDVTWQTLTTTTTAADGGTCGGLHTLGVLREEGE